MWDAVAAGYAGQAALPLPELAGATAAVEVAVLTQSADPVAALGFARYLADPDHGLRRFRVAGFRTVGVEGVE